MDVVSNAAPTYEPGLTSSEREGGGGGAGSATEIRVGTGEARRIFS